MSEDSDKEDPHFSNSTSEEVESDEDSFIQFVPEDIQQYECSDATCDPYAQRSTQIVFEYQSGRRVRRLREPRSLYGVFSTNSIPIARWPYECEVIEERVLHIEYYPPNPEPIYRATGLEREPPYVDPGQVRIVYLANEASKAPYFICSRVGGNRHIPRVATPVPREVSSNSLIFEARFESGNLQKVVQVGDYSYQLTLRSDLYTDRHTQWYYFRVQNTKAGVPYRFTIINFAKSSSLYNVGMRPLMYSELEAASHKVGWKRVGDEIKYYRNGLEQDRQQHYSLSWTFKFQHHKDTCYFAHCYPYTYSNLQRYLADIANDPERSKFCKIRVLCHSLARNMVYVLTITNPSKSNEELKRKRAVIVTARVHPGETNSSWMMKGFLDYILSSKKDACLLRDHFIFKVVPMLNPDGVIVGNYRCSLSGRDLNRNYRSILKDSFPSVWYTCNMIKRIKNEREVLLYCDLHGHSRKQNIFMYGCGTRGQPETMRLKERVFPLILHKNCPDKFSFLSCKFKVQRSKEGTGRVVMWRMGISNSYTMEATFCGSTLGRRRGTHFSTKDLESMGYHFCDALLDYCDPDQSKYHHCFKELEEMVKHSKGRLGKALSDTEATLVDGEWDQESSTEGSDSSESNDLPAHLLDLASKGKFRKKRLKSKKERNSCFVHLEMTNDDLTEQSQSPQGNITPSEKKPTSGKVLHKLGSKNTLCVDRPSKPRHIYADLLGNHLTHPSEQKLANPVNAFQAHAHYREKFDVLQRLPINPISNLPRRSFLNDLSSKKVSVIYLLFNSHGHVITSKSHSNFQKEGLRQVNHGLKEFSWSTPQHLMPSLPSDSIIVPATTNHSTVSQSSYYIEANAEDVDECTPCMHEEQFEPREEVNTNRCKRVQKSAVSSLPPTGKHSGTVRRPLRDSHCKKDPVPTLLSKQSFRDLLHPRRTYASTPIYSAKTEDWQKSPGHRRNKRNQPKQLMLLKNLSERAEIQDLAHRELTTKILENLELSLPTLPAVSTSRRKVQMTSPNSLNEVVTAAISSQLSHLPHRHIEGWSPRQSYTSASSHQQQKPSRGDTHHPGRDGDEAKWSNAEVFTPVTKYTKLPPGTWKSVLPSQETESVLRTEASNNPLPGIHAQFNEQ